MNHRKKQNSLEKFFQLFDIYPREYFVMGFFALFFFAIIWETFSYTVLETKFYQNLANKQQVGEVQVPVNRGTIYTAPNLSSKQESVFSTSVDLNDLAIDPQMVWDKVKLQNYLTEILYKEMCELKEQEECYSDLLRFLKVLEIPDFIMQEAFIKAKIQEFLSVRLAQTKVTSVLLEKSITPEQERSILLWWITWVYPSPNGLYVNPEELVEVDAFVMNYKNMFGGTDEDIKNAIRRREIRYIPIVQKLSLLISDEVESYKKEELTAYSQWIIKEEEMIGKFIILSPRAQRVYPEGFTASQILWFLSNDAKWHYGIEGYFHDILKWNPGEKVGRKDIQGRPIDPISFEEEDTDALEGASVYTTIDRNIQRKVEQILEDGVKKYRANRGTVVVMDPHTGKILSMANYPSFDPNNPGEVYELKKVTFAEYPNPSIDLLGKTVFIEDNERGQPYYINGNKVFLRDALREEYGDNTLVKYTYKNEFWAAVYQNDAISSLYEPGSIMKAITVSAGIDSEEITPTDRYNDEGSVKIDNFTIKNVAHQCLGYNTYINALNFSCNVWMIRIVQKIGKALFYKYLLDFWFSDPTWITLEWEVYSKLDPYERWPMSRLLTTSYGLWVSVTPLQMAAAYSVIANGWIYMKPYIVEKIEYADGKTINFKPEPLRRVIKKTTSEQVSMMLIHSVEDGLAKPGWVPGYKVAGKTWTSQIAYKGGYESWIASTNASFAGFAPAEDPQFVIVVKLERPRANIHGASTSSHLFSEITKAVLDYYGIPKKEELEAK